ncbi:MAG: ABC transporter ATP-binding protein [Gemmatimonadales bacterium]
MILRATNLSVCYPGSTTPALDSVSVAVDAGELVAIVGPNGGGKTTLLGATLGTLARSAGRVEILDRALDSWTPRDLARVIGVVTQREEMAFPLRVRESVGLGRYARLAALAAPGAADEAAVADAMRRANVAGLAMRRTDTLSGGEWQRVRVARALAQEPRLLVLDEPTAALDVRHEMEVFELIRRLCTEGIGTLLVTHHLNLAARYADRMLLLHQGRLVVDGRPADVLRAGTLAEVFEWPVAITSWCDGAPQVIPLKPGESPAG